MHSGETPKSIRSSHANSCGLDCLAALLCTLGVPSPTKTARESAAFAVTTDDTASLDMPDARVTRPVGESMAIHHIQTAMHHAAPDAVNDGAAVALTRDMLTGRHRYAWPPQSAARLEAGKQVHIIVQSCDDWTGPGGHYQLLSLDMANANPHMTMRCSCGETTALRTLMHLAKRAHNFTQAPLRTIRPRHPGGASAEYELRIAVAGRHQTPTRFVVVHASGDDSMASLTAC